MHRLRLNLIVEGSYFDKWEPMLLFTPSFKLNWSWKRRCLPAKTKRVLGNLAGCFCLPSYLARPHWEALS